MTVIVTAVFTPSAGHKDQLIAALREAIPAVHAEDGCELYAIHDAEDGTITMLEKWTTPDALAIHAAGPAVVALNELIAAYIATPPIVTTMIPLAAGTQAQGEL